MTEATLLLLLCFTNLLLALKEQSKEQNVADELSLNFGRILENSLEQINQQQCSEQNNQPSSKTKKTITPRLTKTKVKEDGPEFDQTVFFTSYVLFPFAVLAPFITINLLLWKRHQKNQLALQQQQKQQERALQHNHTLTLNFLNNTMSKVTQEAVWHKGTRQGDFVFPVPKPMFFLTGDSDCQLPASLFEEILVPVLQKHLPVSVDPDTSTLTCHIDPGSDEHRAQLTKASLVSELQAEMLNAIKSQPAYQEHSYHKALAETRAAEMDLVVALRNWVSRYEKAGEELSTLRDECHSLGQTESAESDEMNDRLKKQLNTIFRLISSYETSVYHTPAQRILSYRELSESICDDQNYLNLQNQFECKQRLNVIKESIQYTEQNARELILDLKNIRNELDSFKQRLGSDKHNKKTAVDDHTPLRKLEEKRMQRALKEAQQAEQQAIDRQEAARKKEEFRQQQAIEKQRKQEIQDALARKKAYQLRMFSEQKARDEARRVESSSSSSSSTTSVSSIQLREKVVTLGDLALRFEQDQEPSDIKTMEYKYAMLSQCLRLFELTHQFCQTDLARRIRNALMHRHRYIVMESLNELVNNIAHQPGKNSDAPGEKLEDLLMRLPGLPSDEQIAALNRALNRLKDTEFCVSLLHVEREEATSRQQLESIHGLLEDLSEIKTKEGLSLALFPDKVLAVKGILLCIGECYQQLIHLSEDTNLASSQEWRSMLICAKALRDNLGHSAKESADDILRYQNFIRRSKYLAEHIQGQSSSSSDIEEPPTSSI